MHFVLKAILMWHIKFQQINLKKIKLNKFVKADHNYISKVHLARTNFEQKDLIAIPLAILVMMLLVACYINWT